MVEVTGKHWKEIVKFFNSETRILRDSYGVPGRKGDWLHEYRRAMPIAARQYEKARDAIKSQKK